jgi:CheY-like chemotaxis protein
LIAAAQRAADRGARVTSQLLAFSRKQRMTPEAIDLNHVVSGMGSLLHSTIGATVRIETVLADDLWPALADPSQIELVILNLAINARDAMPAGGTMTIRTANATLGLPSRPEEPPAGDHVMISVADTGTGIAAEILDRVFEPFFTTKEVGRGSGLGLPQVLGVAQQLGGGVRVATRAGEGTVFEVYLPRAPSSLSAVADEQVPRERRESISSGGDVVILLIDDDDEVRSVTASMLRDAGYDVVEAASGSAGLEKLERDSKRIELMVVDFAMPGMNGVEVAELARRMRPGFPILFITGFADTAMLAEHASPEEILQKPFRTAEIAARVAKMLGRSSEPGNEAGSLEPRSA